MNFPERRGARDPRRGAGGALARAARRDRRGLGGRSAAGGGKGPAAG